MSLFGLTSKKNDAPDGADVTATTAQAEAGNEHEKPANDLEQRLSSLRERLEKTPKAKHLGAARKRCDDAANVLDLVRRELLDLAEFDAAPDRREAPRKALAEAEEMLEAFRAESEKAETPERRAAAMVSVTEAEKKVDAARRIFAEAHSNQEEACNRRARLSEKIGNDLDLADGIMGDAESFVAIAEEEQRAAEETENRQRALNALRARRSAGRVLCGSCKFWLPSGILTPAGQPQGGACRLRSPAVPVNETEYCFDAVADDGGDAD